MAKRKPSLAAEQATMRGDWLILASKAPGSPVAARSQPGQVEGAPSEPAANRASEPSHALEIPGLRLVNPLNGSHGHWRVAAKRRKEQREAVGWAWIAAGLPRNVVWPVDGGCPLHVRITRLGPRELDDDNLAAACKSIRDSVAQMLGVNDRLRIWSYDQERSKEYSCWIEVWLGGGVS